MPPPPEYIEFVLRRAIWKELGKDIDDMPAVEVQLYAEFMRLEEYHARRRKRS